MVALSSGPLFIKRTDVISQDLVKSRSRKIGCYNIRIAVKFDSSSGEGKARFQLNLNCDGKTVSETGPRPLCVDILPAVPRSVAAVL